MTRLVRPCPKCGTERGLQEVVCAYEGVDGAACGFSLINVRPGRPKATETPATPAEPPPIETETGAPPAALVCPNGHEVEDGDVDCVICGAALVSEPSPEASPHDVAEELPEGPAPWQFTGRLGFEDEDAELFSVEHSETGQAGTLRWFTHGMEPRTRIYRVLETLDHPNLTRLIDHGRDGGRAWEVWEPSRGETLAELLESGRFPGAHVKELVSQLSAALASLEDANLRHGNVAPCSIRYQAGETPVFELSDLSTATLAEFDLEAGNASPLTRYASPEAVIGSQSVASDWWSLGIVLLEVLTEGQCFAQVNDRAFILQVIARGIELPAALPPDQERLLKGLLTRDHARRWRGDEVRRWLAGEDGIPVFFEDASGNERSGDSLILGSRAVWSAADFALAAATAENWDEAYGLVETGTVATWLAARGEDSQAGTLQSIMDERRVEPDARFALALLALNPHLPLVVRGDIQSPNRLLEDAAAASVWFERQVVAILKRLKRESWLVRLAERAQRVRARAEEMGLGLVEARFNVARLAAFEARLESFWRERRRLFPDAGAPGIAALLERRTLTDEDLILLICAEDSAFRAAEDVLDEAEQLARDAGVSGFNRDSAAEVFDLSKRQVRDELSDHFGAFKRCGNDVLDRWADALRLGRRLSLSQLIVLRASDETSWAEPPHQDYLRNILDFLQKKILLGVQRGPLVKLQIGRSASRMDLTALGDADLPRLLLDRLLKRDEQPVALPAAAGRTDERQRKLTSIVRNSELHRRETGVSALVLAWPLIGFEDKSLSGASAIRLAPIFLWPVRIRKANGQISIGFDPDRDPELNPALERLLSETVLAVWRRKLEPVLKGEAASLTEVSEAFDGLAERPASLEIGPVPQASDLKGETRSKVISAGAVMLADFPSQAIVEDLRQITARPLAGSALEPLLRLVDHEPEEVPGRGGELDRFSILDADPSQEEAVRAARIGSGIKLEGPPGTGKSQTIVNTVTDCIGRGETVVVVCEKQAALEVVHKRLRAEGLGHRVVRIENTQSDRKRLLEELKAQIPKVLAVPRDRTSELRTLRSEKAAVVDQLETELSTYHEAVYAASEALGLSYRQIVSRIAALEGEAAGLSAPDLRARLGAMQPSDLERLISECLGLLETWYEADFSDPSLSLFRVFTSDAAIQHQLTEAFQAIEAAEADRRAALSQAEPMSGLASDVSSGAIEDWLKGGGARIRKTAAKARKRAARWSRLLKSQPGRPSEAKAKRERLDELIEALRGAAPLPEERDVYPRIEQADRDTLGALAAAAELFSAGRGFLDALNPGAILSRRRVRRTVRLLGISDARSVVEAACRASAKEIVLRDARSEYEALARGLSLNEDVKAMDADALRDRAARLLGVLDQALELAGHVERSPWPSAFWDALGATQDVWEATFLRLEAAARLAAASARVTSRLDGLAQWAEESWLTRRRSELSAHAALDADPGAIIKALPNLMAYQTFRSSQISDPARSVFAALAPQRSKLDRDNPARRGDAVAAFVRREAAHAWAEMLRQETPALASPPQKVAADVTRLERAEKEMRDINQTCLGHIDSAGFAGNHAWSQILNIGGVKARRLRQVFDEGRDLGLLQARPIWLVNPDVASRVFPLEPGLFDVAIFDEASQTRVENAIAALYRAKRALISGDTKQLPPTAFFGAAVGDEDDDEFLIDAAVGEDADAETAERRRQEQALNRRHVKDCQDLLALSQGVLTERSLTIHYRSAYRELIEFSNAAFYAGQLNIPVNHPEAEIVRYRPIDVVRVDGTYRNQTNNDEADAVVDHLAALWLSAGDDPPTSGVVTFNLKQAELIEEKLQNRADRDRAFRVALERERSRKADGEDVSFFVRNLENVQGDERDIIVFSTTFGRDAKGTFKRSFGVLTQSGGERRLNVAVTRAKQKVLVMTSMPTSEISDFIGSQRGPAKARDYLQAYLRYAELVTGGELEAARSILGAFDVTSMSDPFSAPDQSTDALVSHVRTILTDKGYETRLRPIGGAFAVDLAVLHPDTGLYCFGVELDGPRHPLLNSARARDLWKPRLLARQGIHVHRVHSPAWAADPARERQRLIRAAKRAVEGSGS